MNQSVLFYGNEAEVKEYQRILDFGENEKVRKTYEALIPSYKNLVNRTLYNLVGEQDNFGYNLSCILSDYKTAEPSIASLKLSSVISYNITPSENSDDNSVDESSRVNLLLKDISKKPRIPMEKTKSHEVIKTLCKQLLLSIELLETGIGKVMTIKDEWLNSFLDEEDDFYEKDKKIFNWTDKWTTLDCLKRYEIYLKKEKRLTADDSIFEEMWAVIKYSGLYQVLELQKGRQDELNAINHLIYDLYAEQLVSGRMPNIPFEENVN